ncbi:MAG: hypothetical protein RI910_2224 [Verrucomicrobiota bacterium]|jgi:hypothetical protein
MGCGYARRREIQGASTLTLGLGKEGGLRLQHSLRSIGDLACGSAKINSPRETLKSTLDEGHGTDGRSLGQICARKHDAARSDNRMTT